MVLVEVYGGQRRLSFRANHRYTVWMEILIIMCAWCHGNYGRLYETVTFWQGGKTADWLLIR